MSKGVIWEVSQEYGEAWLAEDGEDTFSLYVSSALGEGLIHLSREEAQQLRAALVQTVGSSAVEIPGGGWSAFVEKGSSE